jgi:hypothetical protein
MPLLLEAKALESSAVGAAIGHPKAEHRMGRNYYLAGWTGDDANAVLAAVGYDFRRPIARLAALLCLVRIVSLSAHPCILCHKPSWRLISVLHRRLLM